MVFFILVAIALVDIFVSAIIYENDFLADLVRPMIILTLFRSQQDFFFMVVGNLKDSFAMLVCITVWVAYFALLGQFLFANTAQGITSFATIR